MLFFNANVLIFFIFSVFFSFNRFSVSTFWFSVTMFFFFKFQSYWHCFDMRGGERGEGRGEREHALPGFEGRRAPSVGVQ